MGKWIVCGAVVTTLLTAWWASRLGRWIDGEAQPGPAHVAGTALTESSTFSFGSVDPFITLSADRTTLTITEVARDDMWICVEVPFTIDTSGQPVTVCRTVKELREERAR